VSTDQPAASIAAVKGGDLNNDQHGGDGGGEAPANEDGGDGDVFSIFGFGDAFSSFFYDPADNDEGRQHLAGATSCKMNCSNQNYALYARAGLIWSLNYTI
jgi:hypothetical protein